MERSREISAVVPQVAGCEGINTAGSFRRRTERNAEVFGMLALVLVVLVVLAVSCV